MLEINNHFYLNFLVGGIDNNLYKPQIDTPFMLVQKSMLSLQKSMLTFHARTDSVLHSASC